MKAFPRKVLSCRLYVALRILLRGTPPDDVASAVEEAGTPAVVESIDAPVAPEPIVTPAEASAKTPPSGIPFPPSMITASEAEFFTQCVQGPLPSGGSIVDLCCFMGSTAVALARGLMQSGRRDEVIAYDLFEWAPWMDGTPTFGIYRPGDTFLPGARWYTSEHAYGLISSDRADRSQFEWDGRPISLLLVDAIKSFEVASQILQTFFPALMPGAVLIHQDYKHYWTGWIHVLQYRLRDHCELLHSVAGGGTVAFTVTKPIPSEQASQGSDLRDSSDREIDDAFEYSLSLLPEDQAGNVTAAHVMLYCHLERRDRAPIALTNDRSLGMDSSAEFAGMVSQFFPFIDWSARVA